MKLVHKKCPSCGAGLDIQSDATEIKCDYCGQSYTVKQEKTEEDINYYQDDSQNVIYLNEAMQFRRIFMIIFFAIFGLSMLIFFVNFATVACSIGKFSSNIDKLNNDINVSNSSYVSKFDQIDDNAFNMLNNRSLEALDKLGGNYTAKHVSSDFTYVGMYLLNHVNDIDNKIYMVYKRDYKDNGKIVTLYVAVLFNKVKYANDTIVLTDSQGILKSQYYKFSDGFSAFGYESDELLFKDVVKMFENTYSIKVSNGLYLK